MKSKLKRSILVFLIISFSLGIGVLWAATPASEKESAKPAEVTKSPEPGKKGEKFVIKGREYCI